MPIPQRPNILPDHVYIKLEAHSAPEVLTTAFLNQCESLTRLEDVASAFADFSARNRFSGPVIELTDDETLGNVRSFRRTAEQLQALTGQDIEAIEERLDHLSGNGTARQREEARIWFESEVVSERHNPDCRLGRPPSWLFRRDEGGTDLFASPECLPWRLGLPWLTISKIPCIGISFGAAEAGIVAYRPTAFDCDFDWLADLWEPLGETKPLESRPDPCKNQGGLREVVVAPPTFGDLRLPIVMFEPAE